MQIKTTYPRDGFTDDEITYLLQNSMDVKVSKGLEVLDQSLNVVEDISDFVESVEVTRDSYADLHATCTARIGRTIDFGNAVIRPYCILQGTIPVVITTSQTVLGVGMSDQFIGGSLDTSKWISYTPGTTSISVSGGQLSITSPSTNTSEPGIVSQQRYNMTGSQASTQLVSAGNQALATNEVWPIMLRLDGNNYIGWIIKQNFIIPTSLTAGVGNYSNQKAYNSSVHKYFRIREGNGITYWETSTDGNTWTVQETRNNQISMTNLEAHIQAGPYSSEAASTTAIFDNFLLGSQTATTSSTSLGMQTVQARFNMGAYFANGDKQDIDSTPRSYVISGVDILKALQDPVGDSYAVQIGDNYLATVENILLSCGYTQYSIDQQAADSAVPAAKVWAMSDNPTWLTVVNDLLAAIGYAGIWSDWDGRLHAAPYISPKQRSPEWFYDLDPSSSMVSFKRSVERDLFDAPNRWVFVQSNRGQGAAPVEGDGIYTYVNSTVGDSSVDARQRTITKKVDIDAADQAGLVAQAQVTIDADMSISTKLSVATFPNPLHWHFDRMVYSDPEFGLLLDVMATKWTWNVGNSDMTQEWSILQ